ncbi:M6 family metalloprotease domain-containing protein [Prevotella melaninogenica]|uniref:M6 family metalloprotease domain-containing protein n=1 Tax=Prevotella melaninogenica TaxID=28132 RepID=UPI001C5DD5BA|nr:M6 family metalloprotease domain-containing protein [Prevotella melaninogenica]MBW4733736.1 M6 family metalloprotease domain-containing protein [Prevotella melaninogenica]MBW4736171.1 M6 family metalloprotease domain-containing protein [Prevotella melaninogenica]MBW4761622.1 M6 family metalloprotease domain-containing protein [Prevotella melaninogenica]MBW4878679.1 M6 family metalloprotease domain-containing protein [Prevotella melaninogenica]
MKTLKQLSLIVCLMLCSLTTWAAKAESIPVQVRQADGSVITVILRGDEHINWYTTLDGVLLVQGADNNYYIGKVEKSGNLIATQQLAHEALTRSQAERNLIAKQDKEKFFAYVNKVAEESENAYNNSPLTRGPIVDTGYGGVPYFPHTGSPKALVILAEFQDTTFTIQDTKKVFTNYLMNEGHFSDTRYGQNQNYKGVRGYFKDCSYGQFTPFFDVVGPIKLPRKHAIYGAGNDRMDLLLADACATVDDLVDFAKYDANNDGIVDLVYIIYAGHSANYRNNKVSNIWPKSGTVTISDTFDGKSIRRYGVSNELNGSDKTSKNNKKINGIGLFCHEFSHTLGLPDIYAYRTPAEDQDDQGMEYWDIMDGGTGVRGGRVPASYLAWEREVMGWMNIDELKKDSSIENLKSIDNGGKAYKIVNPNNSNEYIVLQSMQKGAWNQGWGDGTYGKGLLAYRVSYPFNKVNVFDYPNNEKGKPRVIPIPADGKILAAANAGGSLNTYIQQLNGDPYPYNGIDKINEFTMYDGTILKRSIYDIVENDVERQVSFKFKNNEPTAIQSLSIVERSTSDNRIYTLDGRYVGTDASILPHGIYIQNNKKFVK